MKISNLLFLPFILFFSLSLVGCGAKDYANYAQAVKEQNITLQLMADKKEAKREADQRAHELKMAQLTANLMTAAAQTPEKSDDVIAPMMVMLLEDKWNMSKSAIDAKPQPAMAQIQAPTTIGDEIKKAGSTLLGLGGIYLGIRQSDNLADIAKTGILNAGTHNTASGGSAVTAGNNPSASGNNPSSSGNTNEEQATDSYNTDNSTNGDSALEPTTPVEEAPLVVE